MTQAQQLRDDAADTVRELNDKVRESILLGRPGDVTRYALGLAHAASAYADLALAGATPDDE